ncbi:AfsR/SARP family transcriptional regulator [Nonomuraea sp. H19]|uniref:AfsR/SARP family transcriptional regulator n=1 Tax=Nonomuraea sp. H19 TaxID=3452206 RepID=UPI003F8BE088
MDSLNFAEHLAAARQAEQDGDLDLALRRLHEALALWRGPALSGVPGPFAEAERARLEELRLTAAKARANALVRLGRPQDALAELQDLTRRHPLRERFSELLMPALFECGRQAEALQVFEEARRLLAEEFGADPGDGLRRAHQLVLRGRDGRAVQDPAPPRQLPRDLIGFVGRASELIRLKSLLDPSDDEHPHPFVAISGPPGIGKLGHVGVGQPGHDELLGPGGARPCGHLQNQPSSTNRTGKRRIHAGIQDQRGRTRPDAALPLQHCGVRRRPPARYSPPRS